MTRQDRPEVWGGIECSIVRVGEAVRDQVAETGHDGRIGDLDLVAGLGIRTLRYPVLWEALSPEEQPLRGWNWHDRRLGRMRELGIRPIVGLIHHGSGPIGTDLLDPGFAPGLARHARRVAARYPWIDAYTPVNEPLTTARFSCLYGHWYPHGRSYRDFLRSLVNQCLAVVLSMRAIREISPQAELVQTEDIGRIFATEPLAGQAAHENERRWLSLDLLFGRVTPGHPWWEILIAHGIEPDELAAFAHAPRPDVIGVNHYLTSDRFLDTDAGAYPEHLRGDAPAGYADAEAVRVPSLDGVVGLAARLREVAARYPCPLAVTELHHGCTREEQLRWLRDGWEDACAVRAEGIDLRAVTVWSLFGAIDWNSLLTARRDHYEPGAFDIRGVAPRPTALATATSMLVRAGRMDVPGASGPGWWRRPERSYAIDDRSPDDETDAAPVLVVIGREGPFTEECRTVGIARGWTVRRVGEEDAGLRDAVSAATACLDATALSGTEPDGDLLRERCLAAAGGDLAYAFLSGPEVFPDGAGTPRFESDRPQAASPRGRRLADMEAVVRRHHAGALVLRSGVLFGVDSDPRFASTLPRRPVDSPDHGAGTHSYLPDLVHAALDLLVDRETGIRHLVNPGISAGRVVPLGTEKGVLLPPLVSALDRRDAERARRGDDLPRLQAAE